MGRGRGRHGAEGAGGHDGGGMMRWLLTYADLITLLAAFFVMMYSTANADLQKFSRLAVSVRTAFNVPLVGTEVFALGPGMGGTGVDLGMGPPVGFTMILANLPQAGRDYVGVNNKMAEFAEVGGVSEQIGVNMSREGIIISIAAGLVFKPGSPELKESSKPTLDRIVELIKPLSNKIRVEGHTDVVPSNSENYPTNWELSAIRAVSVVRYLVEEGGIAPERLSAVACSQYKPLYPNDTREHRAMNRRANILIVYPTGLPGVDIPLAREEGASMS